MGKRSNYSRRILDSYATPFSAVAPLLLHLGSGICFDEPCAGDRALVSHLTRHGHQCARASDIADEHPVDAFNLERSGADMFITNPPWDWDVLDPLIDHLSNMKPTWLLLNADLMHNKRMGRHMRRCLKVVSIGRIKWIEGSKSTGMENCAWFLFVGREVQTLFYGREWRI